MTTYRTCWGCARKQMEGGCPTLDAVRKQLKGLGVTTIKWRCPDREPQFKSGDPVWGETVADHWKDIDYYDQELDIAWFPGHFVRQVESKAIVHIAPDAPSEEQEDLIFVPKYGGSGFCKLPLSRIKHREGDREKMCGHCDLPAPRGHEPGCPFYEGSDGVEDLPIGGPDI